MPAQSFSTTLSVYLSTDSILFDIFDANKEKRVKCLIIRDRLFQVTSQYILTNPLRFIVTNVPVNVTVLRVLRSDLLFSCKASYKCIHEFNFITINLCVCEN